jgi:hypothetical protein
MITSIGNAEGAGVDHFQNGFDCGMVTGLEHRQAVGCRRKRHAEQKPKLKLDLQNYVLIPVLFLSLIT